LTDDGVMMCIRSAVRRPDATNPWIAKYIFPAATFRPFRSAAGDRASVSLVCDVEILRLHYRDVKAGREAFKARREEGVQLYDEPSLGLGVLSGRVRNAFRKPNLMNFQIQLTNARACTITRGYVEREGGTTAGPSVAARRG